MSFNPKDHMIDLKGKDYLPVAWRIVWFREDHPNGAIRTECVSQTPPLFRATVLDEDGRFLSDGHASATLPAGGRAVWSGREFEKAETAAIGRALAHAGYGTQFDAEDEGDYLADSPVDPSTRKPGAGMKDETGDRPAANGKPAPATDNAKVNREKGWNTDAGLIQALRAIWDHPVPEMLNRLKKMEEADEIGRNDPQADVLKAYELHMAAKK